MAATAEWDVPFFLETVYGTLTLNAATGERYLLVPQACDMGANIRATVDNVPQADGSVLHHRFETGYFVQLSLQLWYGDAPACNEDLELMVDTLNLHVRALINAGDNEGRLYWTPSGAANRMVDDLRLLERLTFAVAETGAVVATFTVDTNRPYAQDHAEITTPIANGGTATLTNDGTTDFFPVMLVTPDIQTPPTPTEFYIGTTTLGSVLHWSSAYPGTPTLVPGDYIEIDFFRNTLYVNGDEDNAKSGFDPTISEFFPLEPGANDVTIIGGDVDVLWQSAWT